jgi:hypothetical protein
MNDHLMEDRYKGCYHVRGFTDPTRYVSELATYHCPVHLLCHQFVRKVSSNIQNRQLPSYTQFICSSFNTILYENEFQNPQIFQQTISLFPEQSTLDVSEHSQ